MTEADMDSPAAQAVFAYRNYLEDAICEVARPYGSEDLAIVFIDYESNGLPGTILYSLEQAAAWLRDHVEDNLNAEGKAEWPAFRDTLLAEWTANKVRS